MVYIMWEGIVPREEGALEGLRRKEEGLNELVSPCGKKVAFLP